jgi:peroxiredoxin
VVVIFYLGAGCVHCIEQLNLFAPVASDYKEAGISIVAVSTESVEGLKRTLEKSKSEEGFPFPLVSNEGLEVFKAYRAYDDFEKMPLHGTFLIDGNGMVRWQDISFEPFTETRFLLGEAQRLLKLSGGPLLTGKKPILKSPRASSL